MAVPQDAKPESDSTAAKQKAPPGKPDPDADLSEEDLELKKNIELMVERLGDADAGVARSALDALTKEIHTTTSSMTAVPKPLKFLRPHLDTLVKLFDAMSPSELRRGIADVLSLLCSTVAGKEGERQGLTYKLQGNTSDLATWGHEYMRHLAGEIAEEYKARTERSADVAELIGLVDQIVPYHMTHNAEPEAVDLLLEVDRLEQLESHIDAANFGRTCLYLTSCCAYLPEPEDTAVLRLAHRIYACQGKHHDALRVALRLGDAALVDTTFVGCTDVLERRQLAYLLARHGTPLNLEEGPAAIEARSAAGRRSSCSSAYSCSRCQPQQQQ